ncbi:MAG: hypothetical protein PIR53_17420 [Nocardioides alkalitolerans]
MGGRRSATTAVTPALWAVAGTALLVQSLLTWTSRGALSTTAPVDVLGLVRAGSLPSVSTTEVIALVTLPVLGAALLAGAALRGRAVRRVRALLGLVAVVVTGLLLVRVADLDPTDLSGARPGAGALLAALGALAALAAIGTDVRSPTPEENPR